MAGPGARVDFSVGLFCTEVFRPELMTERIAGEMGIALDQIERFNVKGEVLIHQRNGAVATIPLETAMHEYQRPECAHCGDFAAELADISCGGVGTDRATIVVLRSQRGIDIWRAYEASGRVEVWPIQEHKKAWNILQRLARRQRERVPASSPGAAPVQQVSLAEPGTLYYSPHQHARMAQEAYAAAQPDPALREASLAAVYGARARPAPHGPGARSPIPGEPTEPGPDGKRKLPPPPGVEQGGASPMTPSCTW
jgi:coenzyme F420 hydrogenase subunit beta